MKYLSSRDTAKKWGISERLVQRYCIQGRIDGAAKLGGVWMIPTDAKKPQDPRRKTEIKKAEGMSAASCAQDKFRDSIDVSARRGRLMMPLANTAFTPGECMAEIESIEDLDERNIALAEYLYFSGQSEGASELAEQYLTSEDIRLKLSASWIYAYANLSLDRISLSRRAIESVNISLVHISEDDPEISAMSVLATTAVSVLLHLPIPENTPSLWDYIYILPNGLRLFALYIKAHEAYLKREYGTSLGIVKTALALEGETFPIPTIYLHLVATMDYMSLKQPEMAKEQLLSAWQLAKPDYLIEPLAELHGLLGGMLEAVIKKEFPADFKKIISITQRFSSGWRRVHNAETGNSVTDDLSTTEFAVAMLAARGWLNKEIALHLGISENTVKQHISTAFQKLGISQRKELGRFMLK